MTRVASLQLSAAEWIALAAKHGAKFVVDPDGKHRAEAWRRGRPVPLFSVGGDTQADAAQRFCRYVHLPGTMPFSEDNP